MNSALGKGKNRNDEARIFKWFLIHASSNKWIAPNEINMQFCKVIEFHLNAEMKWDDEDENALYIVRLQESPLITTHLFTAKEFQEFYLRIDFAHSVPLILVNVV